MSAPVPDGVRACTAVEWRQAVRDAGDGRLFVKSDLLVLLALSIRMSADGSEAFPSMATLAEDTGVSVGTVKRALRLARESGFLVVERRGGRRGDGSTVSNRYRAVVPDSPGQGSTRDPLTEPQGSTGEPLNLASRGHQRPIEQNLKGSPQTPQGVTTDPLPRPLPRELPKSCNGFNRAATNPLEDDHDRSELRARRIARTIDPNMTDATLIEVRHQLHEHADYDDNSIADMAAAHCHHLRKWAQ